MRANHSRHDPLQAGLERRPGRIGVGNERKQGIIERLNRLIDAKNKPDSKLPDTSFQEQLNKLKEVTERDQKIKMTVAFSTFEKLTLEEVKANK
jgi:hypothetical protein